MKTLAVVFVLSTCFLWTATLAGSVKPSGRIIGGIPANAAQFPFTAAITVSTSTSRFFCSGALLGDRWIVTAGQCVDQAVQFTIQLGSNTLTGQDPNRLTVATSTYFLHPDYNPETLENDIGLIELRIPIEFTDYIKAVYSIPVDFLPPEFRVLAMGWGQTSDDDPELSDHLNYVTTSTLDNNECRLLFGPAITDNMVCVSGNYNEGTCVGDTGSPLIYLLKFGNPQLQGVASFVSGRGCESTDPSGYTRVYPYSDWIVNITGVAPR